MKKSENECKVVILTFENDTLGKAKVKLGWSSEKPEFLDMTLISGDCHAGVSAPEWEIRQVAEAIADHCRKLDSRDVVSKE